MFSHRQTTNREDDLAMKLVGLTKNYLKNAAMRLKVKLHLSYKSDRYLGGETKKNPFCAWNNVS